MEEDHKGKDEDFHVWAIGKPTEYNHLYGS
jgi:hypothetical protein